jgi:hypothetical protein
LAPILEAILEVKNFFLVIATHLKGTMEAILESILKSIGSYIGE